MEKLFGLNKRKRLLSNLSMKRYIIYSCLALATVWFWCNFSPASDVTHSSATATNAPPINLTAEIALAKAENKLLLLEFGSSDSCPPCILFEQKVFSTPEFKAYEKSNLVFVRIDFPLKTDFPPDARATNALLSQQFDQYFFPTFIALDADGKEFWRIPEKGMEPAWPVDVFTPQKFIALLESLKTKEK
jgi:thioredoxin-related protein